jgi:hypothetical protein
MIRTYLTLFLLLFLFNLSAQKLSINETLDYINNNLSKYAKKNELRSEQYQVYYSNRAINVLRIMINPDGKFYDKFSLEIENIGDCSNSSDNNGGAIFINCKKCQDCKSSA